MKQNKFFETRIHKLVILVAAPQYKLGVGGIRCFRTEGHTVQPTLQREKHACALFLAISLKFPNATTKAIFLLVGVWQTSLDGVETFRSNTDLGTSVLKIEESVFQVWSWTDVAVYDVWLVADVKAHPQRMSVNQ